MMELGTMVHFDGNVSLEQLEQAFEKLAQFGFTTCQLNCWDAKVFTDENAEEVKRISAKTGIRISALWCGYDFPCVWNFTEGYHTIGLVPISTRAHRIQNLKDGSDFAKKIGVDRMATHVGFLPENPKTDEYEGVVAAIREVALYCKKNGQYFLFETGQETPITLLRTIQKINTGNLGVNLDPANLLLYGKANPCDAVDIFGDYVMGVHGKDGEYPTDGDRFGLEKRIGDGRVNFPLLLKKLKEHGYDDAITIEREIRGDEQIKDILYAKSFLENIIKELG